jgi:hypothetical protein
MVVFIFVFIIRANHETDLCSIIPVILLIVTKADYFISPKSICRPKRHRTREHQGQWMRSSHRWRRNAWGPCYSSRRILPLDVSSTSSDVFSSSKGGAEDMVAEMLVTNDLVFISCTEALLHYLLGTKDEPPPGNLTWLHLFLMF